MMQLSQGHGRVAMQSGQSRFAVRKAFTASSRKRAVQVRAEKCLIVNTKGGGHSFIGLYLAKQLIAKGHDVTVMNDGDQVRKVTSSPSAHGVDASWCRGSADPAL